MLRFNYLHPIWYGRKVLRRSSYYQSGGPKINHGLNKFGQQMKNSGEELQDKTMDVHGL
jgi:hypothetical protein